MLYNMAQITEDIIMVIPMVKNEIKTALFNKISYSNPQLAEAIAYRSTRPHVFGNGDLASLYDHYNMYKKELQFYLLGLTNIVLHEPVSHIKTVTVTPVTNTLIVTNTPTYEYVNDSYTYTIGWEITIVYKDGSKQTYTMTIQNLF